MTSYPRRLLRFPEVKMQVGLGRTCIYQLIQKNQFPPSIPIGARAVAWDSEAIDKWIDSRIAASQGKV